MVSASSPFTAAPGPGAGKYRNLRFASVNIDTLRNYTNLNFQRNTINDLKLSADIICVQETKLTVQMQSSFLLSFQGSGVFSPVPEIGVEAHKATTGVAILFTAGILKQGLSVLHSTQRCDSAGRWVAVDIKWNNTVYTVVSVYAPADDQLRVSFLSSLYTDLSPLPSERLLILGDFNTYLDRGMDSQRQDRSRGKRGAAEFEQFVTARHLVDVWRCAYPATRAFTSPLREGWQPSRIDFCLASSDIAASMVASAIDERREKTRHAVVRMSLLCSAGPEFAKGKSHFRVFPSLLEDSRFTTTLKAEAERLMISTVHLGCEERYEVIKNNITRLAREESIRFRGLEEQEVTVSRRIIGKINYERLQGAAQYHREEELHIHRKVLRDTKLRRSERMTIAALGTLRREADRPTAGWLKAAKAEHHRHAFRAVRIPAHNNGGTHVPEQRVTKLSDMATALRHFWGTISHSDSPGINCVKPPRASDDWDFFLKLIGSSATPLSAPEVEKLGAPISKSELEEVKDELGNVIDIGIVRALPRNKSAGPDGWPYEFVQLLFPIIGEAMVAGWNSARTNETELPGGAGLALLHLLYKPSKDASKINDPELASSYRPVSLLNSDYKLLARVLVARLLCVINRLIHSDQAGFVPGRSMEDTIRLQQDIIHFFERIDAAEFATGGRFEGGVGFKAHDLKKAYG